MIFSSKIIPGNEKKIFALFGALAKKQIDVVTEKDHFVHISGLIDEIREGDEVTFDLKEGNKGLNAVNVKVI